MNVSVFPRVSVRRQRRGITGPGFNTMEIGEEYKRPGESLQKYESFMASGVTKIKYKKGKSDFSTEKSGYDGRLR